MSYRCVGLWKVHGYIGSSSINRMVQLLEHGTSEVEVYPSPGTLDFIFAEGSKFYPGGGQSIFLREIEFLNV